jgi:hypothetical protein
VGPGPPRVELDRVAVVADRLVLLAGVLGDHAEVVVRGGVAGIDVDRAGEAIVGSAR